MALSILEALAAMEFRKLKLKLNSKLSLPRLWAVGPTLLYD